MSESLIKVGDIVAFKSNLKLKMTVEHIYQNDATCVWFHPITFDFQRQKIKLEAIVKTD
jgi:hypothetical protein